MGTAVFRRYRVTLATDSALANAHAKSVEESAHDLSRAIVLNRQTKSVDRNQRILHVLTLLDTYGSSRAVREIHELICDTGMRQLTLEQIPTSCHQAPRPEVR
jgi:hypothetical protein